jgi:hypothetical protein
MKRFRVLSWSFDTRARILGELLTDSEGGDPIPFPEDHRQQIIESLVREYGVDRVDTKVLDFTEFGALPFSILAFHHIFFEQARRAFVIGAYYPALTATCALGERILNHLIFTLRDDFKLTPEYKEVYARESVDDWKLAIRILKSWNVLLPDVAQAFEKLRKLRIDSLHFKRHVDQKARELALQAAEFMRAIVDRQFGALGTQSWFIPSTPGESFIAKEAEASPFIQRVYRPSCELVGPSHTLKWNGSGFDVLDEHEYDDREVTDDEFRILRAKAQQAG